MHYEGTRGELELKEAVYRIDPHTGALALVTDALAKPNGLCFSPDYQKLYIVDTGVTHNPDHPREITVWDVVDGQRLRHGRTFATMVFEGMLGMSDGIRADIAGNIWAAAGWGGAGFDGVHIFAAMATALVRLYYPRVAPTCASADASAIAYSLPAVNLSMRCMWKPRERISREVMAWPSGQRRA